MVTLHQETVNVNSSTNLTLDGNATAHAETPSSTNDKGKQSFVESSTLGTDASPIFFSSIQVVTFNASNRAKASPT